MDYHIEISANRLGHSAHTLGSYRIEHEEQAIEFAIVMEATRQFQDVQVRKNYTNGENKIHKVIVDGEVYDA